MKKNWDSILAAIAGFVIIILYTRHGGIGISPDSMVYMSAAENFHDHGRFAEFTGFPVIDFPFFYSFFLSVMMWLTGLKPLLFSLYVNALLFGAIIYISGVMIEKFQFSSKWYKAAILSCIVLSPGLLEDYSMLWSETVFILLLLLVIIQLNHYLRSNSKKALIAAAVFTSLACITRYAGVTIIALGGMLIILHTKIGLKKKIKDLFLFSVISSLLLISNLVRNYIVSETLTGDRESSVTSFNQNVHNVGKVFCDWFPFLSGHYSFATILAYMIIIGLAIICARAFFRNGIIEGYPNIAAAFSLIYILFMIVMASISRQEDLNSRFLSPAFIPLLWSGSNWIVSLYQKSKKMVVVFFGLILFSGFQYIQLKADTENWDGIKDAGIPGYTEDSWRNSETLLFLKKNISSIPDSVSIYSDAPEAIYLFTGRSAFLLPHKESKIELEVFMDDKKCYVVWFNEGIDPDVVDQSFIVNEKKMKLLNQFSDGSIYITGK